MKKRLETVFSPSHQPDSLDLTICQQATIQLASRLIHDFRNQINLLILHTTNLQEQLAEKKPACPTFSLAQQVREITHHFQNLQEELQPSLPQKESKPLSYWLSEIETNLQQLAFRHPHPPPFPLISHFLPQPLKGSLRLDSEQINKALGKLALNAWEACSIDPQALASIYYCVTSAPSEKSEANTLVFSIQNPLHTQEAPPFLKALGKIPGISTKPTHLGSGCFFAAQVAKAHGGSCQWYWDPQLHTFTASLRLPLEEELTKESSSES